MVDCLGDAGLDALVALGARFPQERQRFASRTASSSPNPIPTSRKSFFLSFASRSGYPTRGSLATFETSALSARSFVQSFALPAAISDRSDSGRSKRPPPSGIDGLDDRGRPGHIIPPANIPGTLVAKVTGSTSKVFHRLTAMPLSFG